MVLTLVWLGFNTTAYIRELGHQEITANIEFHQLATHLMPPSL